MKIPMCVRVKLVIHAIYGHLLPTWNKGAFLDIGAAPFYSGVLNYLDTHKIPCNFSESTFRKAFTLWLNENYP